MRSRSIGECALPSAYIRSAKSAPVLIHTSKPFLPDRVATTKVRKRVDAASVVFDASDFESLLDSVEKVDENFALAVSKRRKKLGWKHCYWHGCQEL